MNISFNKKASLVLILAAPFFLTACSFFGLNSQKTELSETTSSSNEPESSQTESGSILDLLKSGVSQKCSYTGSNESGNLGGDVYISGNKMRSNGQITMGSSGESKTYNSYMISDGMYIYAWSDLMPAGTKMKFTEAEGSVPDETGSDSYTEYIEELKGSKSYKCTPWIADESLFEVPSNINFIDLTAAGIGTSEGSSKPGCVVCELLQDEESKKECIQRLDC